MLSQEFIDEMKTMLLAEKQRLSAELSDTPEHIELGREYDENAQEVERDEVSADLRERISGDLEKIEKALGKIEAGTYGTDNDGNEISEERLRVIPWADQAI